MSLLETEIPVSTGLPGLDKLIGGGIHRRDSILIASADSRQSVALTAQIARNIATVASTLSFGLPLEPAAHLHPCDEEIATHDHMTEALAYAAGRHTPSVAAFGLLEQFTDSFEYLEENIEQTGLAIIRAGHRRGFATVMTARLESDWTAPAPLDALGVYDPMGGHVHLALFIDPVRGAASEDEVSIRVLKWRFGPCCGAVRATWDRQNGTFECPAQEVRDGR